MPVDAWLTRDGPVNAPLDYVVPAAAEMVPLAVSATFADPGNVGPYIPAVEVVTPTGVVLGPFPLDGQIAAGASARVSWFRGVAASANSNNPPIPGTILGIYGGHSPASDFTTNSTTYVQTNFPTNTSFTKVSSQSALGIYGEFDFTSGASPDTLFVSVFIDGVISEATGIQISQAGTFCTAVIVTVKGIPGTLQPPLAAGVHTVDVRVACNAGVNFTLRTSTSVDLAIIEFVS